jgi:uncharacterized protein (TIGR00255 family)
MAMASMTGFGRARGELSDRYSATVVVRSVNHKYLDIQVRTNLREETPELEAAVRGIVSGSVARGRVTVQVNLEKTAPADTTTMVDGEAMVGVLGQLRAVEEDAGGGSSLQLRDVLSIPGLITVSSRETQLEASEVEALQNIVKQALSDFVAMRREEAVRLEEQLVAELARISDFLDELEPELDEIRERILGRLRERINRLLGTELEADPERVVQEAALLADRSDVSEEMTRLRSHLEAFGNKLAQGGTVGRTLDFLCQEINRELNTLGSKCREVGVAERLIEAKAATERIREQVQNLE